MYKTGQLTLLDDRGVSLSHKPMTPKLYKNIHQAAKDDQLMWVETYPSEITMQAYNNTERNWTKKDWNKLSGGFRKAHREIITEFNDEYEQEVYQMT
jgi:hypothetical protein